MKKLSRDPWKRRSKKAKAARLGSAPIEVKYADQMQALADALDTSLNGDARPKKTGFILLLFPFGDTSRRCNYISNADRADVKILLREQLAYFEGMPDNAAPEATQ